MHDRAPEAADGLIARLRAAAPVEDGGRSLGPSMRRVLAAGLPEDGDAAGLCRLLVAVAEANLPVARILEGHANARLLLARLAPAMLDDAAIYGVWGADGDAPLRLEDGRLAGGKRFASGLGTVTDAVVTVGPGVGGAGLGGDGGGARLALVCVRDAGRHRPGTWRMRGMRATASGDVDLTGLVPRLVGGPGDYFVEPTFIGGVWRIAAVQLGGTLGLIAAARDALDAARRLGAEAQVARLAPLVARAMAAAGLVERAAAVASGPAGAADPERAVALSIQARLLTEDLAQDAVAAVERSVGLAHFAETSETGRIARDLATYCRQAARDAMAQRAGRIALGRPGPLSAFWHG